MRPYHGRRRVFELCYYSSFSLPSLALLSGISTGRPSGLSLPRLARMEPSARKASWQPRAFGMWYGGVIRLTLYGYCWIYWAWRCWRRGCGDRLWYIDFHKLPFDISSLLYQLIQGVFLLTGSLAEKKWFSSSKMCFFDRYA